MPALTAIPAAARSAAGTGNSEEIRPIPTAAPPPMAALAASRTGNPKRFSKLLT
jgi:hypothetical protein